MNYRYLGDSGGNHPVIDYRVCVSRCKTKRSSSNERAMAAGLSKMLRRFRYYVMKKDAS